MAEFPAIQSHCPDKGPLADTVEGTVCRLRHREVHDPNAMTEAERIALLSGAGDGACVSYTAAAPDEGGQDRADRVRELEELERELEQHRARREEEGLIPTV